MPIVKHLLQRILMVRMMLFLAVLLLMNVVVLMSRSQLFSVWYNVSRAPVDYGMLYVFDGLFVFKVSVLALICLVVYELNKYPSRDLVLYMRLSKIKVMGYKLLTVLLVCGLLMSVLYGLLVFIYGFTAFSKVEFPLFLIGWQLVVFCLYYTLLFSFVNLFNKGLPILLSVMMVVFVGEVFLMFPLVEHEVSGYMYVFYSVFINIHFLPDMQPVIFFTPFVGYALIVMWVVLIFFTAYHKNVL